MLYHSAFIIHHCLKGNFVLGQTRRRQIVRGCFIGIASPGALVLGTGFLTSARAPVLAVSIAVSEKLELPYPDLDRAPVVPFLVLPFTGNELTAHAYLGALVEVLAGDLRSAAESACTKPVGTLLLLTALIPEVLVYGNVQVRYGQSRLGVPDFRIGSEVPCNGYDVHHGFTPLS